MDLKIYLEGPTSSSVVDIPKVPSLLNGPQRADLFPSLCAPVRIVRDERGVTLVNPLTDTQHEECLFNL